MSSKRIFGLIVFLLVVATLIVAPSRSQKGEPIVKQIPGVMNDTRSLEAISAFRNGGELYLAVRNDYSKNVTAFVVSIGDFRFTEEFVYSEADVAGILPQGTYERTIPLPSSLQTGPFQPINIQAVVLEDGTADGNSVIVKNIRDERLGERIQIERTLRLLEKYLNLSSSKINERLGEMKSQIVSQLDSSEVDSVVAVNKLGRQTDTLPEEIKGGLDTAKQGILRKLQDLESAQNPKGDLLKVKEHYDKVLRRL